MYRVLEEWAGWGYGTGYPLHRENRENDLSGKTQGIWKFCQTQGILFVEVVKFLILKIRDIAIIAAYFRFFSMSVSLMNLSQISEISTGKISS